MKQRKKSLAIGAAVLCIVAVVLILVLVLPGGGAGETAAKDDVAVETSVCTLYYPGEWGKDMWAEVTEEAVNTAVEFYGSAGGQEALLYTVHLGGAEGIPVGILEHSDGYVMDVTLEVSDFVPDENLSTEDADRLCAMQETMNDVIQNLAEEPGFTPAE